MPIQATIINPDFEAGDTGWAKEAGWSITNAPGTFFRDGTWAARWDGGNGAATNIINEAKARVTTGRSVTAELWANVNGSGTSQGGVHANLYWYDANENLLGETTGTIVRGTGTSYQKSTVTGTAPNGAAFVSMGARAYRNSNPRPFFIDSASWNYVYDREATLTSPQDGAELLTNSIVQLRVDIKGTQPAITSVTYLQNGVDLASVGTAPYGYNTTALSDGEYEFQARVNLADGSSILTNTSTVTVTAAPPVPETREFRASNAYTYLVGENFSGLTAAMPPTARVLGVELAMDYSMDVIVRASDLGVADQSTANYNVAFDAVSGGTIEAVLLSKSGDSYSRLGNPLTTTIPIVANGFTLFEDGTSEGRRYSHLTSSSNSTATIGGESERFGQDPEFGNIFNTRAIGLRFYPNPSALPSYAGTGDAVYRWFLNRLKLRVFFDAGSVEYYFASPDKTQVIKGELVHSYVESGAFRSGDATGVLQLQPTLEIVDGSQSYIDDDWTIHSAYPPDNANQIGVVSRLMEYNGLPTQKQIIDNRSRYQFITANFYGDKKLNSIYGAHGFPRAFAYNREFFYKIYTQPDPEQDSPRHVAYHHGHLALGFEQGNVDISVVGQPYNFYGEDGASSWAIGDNVTGLLSLSGTILGVFAGKSIWGISGTTVDNFATQVISPKLGAIEYTIADMGAPVYANAYGIYTLSQTQEYGDYLGTPLSQDISPWLRPRLNRKGTSKKEVVAAWPVRSKNQYRLAFSDGYIVTMTTNGGSAPPSFSFRKYFITPPNPDSTWGPLAGEYVFENLAYMPNVSSLVGSNVVPAESTGGELPYGGAWRLEFENPVRLRLSVSGNAYSGFTWDGGEFHVGDRSSGSPYGFDNMQGSVVTTGLTSYLEYSTGISPNTSYQNENYSIKVEVARSVPAPSLYDYPSIIPIAISSELDEAGEERVHMADIEVYTPPPVIETRLVFEVADMYGNQVGGA